MKDLPFDGIRVADFGWVITAPLATLWLATMGAEVIKVESKTHPDVIRAGMHGGIASGPEPTWHRCGGFNSLNYSKYSCCLDLNQEEARSLGHEIVKKSDIVIEAFTTPIATRFGLTYDQLKEIKPDVILVSCSSLGKTGPLQNVTGFGPANQAFAGLPSMTGYEGGTPMSMGGTWPDYICGVIMGYLAVSALYHRAKTGEGMHIDFSMAEAVMNMVPGQLLDYQMNGRVATPMGNSDTVAVPHEVYPSQGEDKWVAIAVHDEVQWRAFCAASGHPEWLTDPRFSSADLRMSHRIQLDASIATWTKLQTAQEITELLQKVGVPAFPSVDSQELIHDPQLQHRSQFIELQQREAGLRTHLGMQGLFSAIPERDYFSTPIYDQDNHRVFQDLIGLSPERIEALVDQGIIN
jgi:crotonobetainyl-CoA:carnitine CoA-transferase CaiB-like acyl-CoA transferase